VSRGGVEPFDGDLDDYQRYLLDEAKRQREAAKEAAKNAAKSEALAQAAAKAASPAAPAKSKGNTSPKLKKEIQEVEDRMQTLNATGSTLEGQLATNIHPHEIAEIGKKLKAVSDELAELENRWLELSEEIGG
jgi:ATP-binding cassette subfamily F protein 3